jgi:two-component system chemotaxis response regulator CheB
MLPQILGRITRLTVAEARSGERLVPGHVHVAPPGRHLRVRPDRTILLSQDEPVWFARPSADRLFESVASVFGERAVAVILTGRGYDGVEGLRAVRQAGGMTIAQSERSCRAPEMPTQAIDAGCVEMVLPPDQIGPMLEILFSPQRDEWPASPDLQGGGGRPIPGKRRQDPQSEQS